MFVLKEKIRIKEADRINKICVSMSPDILYIQITNGKVKGTNERKFADIKLDCGQARDLMKYLQDMLDISEHNRIWIYS